MMRQDSSDRNQPSRGGIVQHLIARTSEHAQRTAVVGDRRCLADKRSYENLWSTVEALAAGLLELGVGHGERMGLVTENSDRWLLADLALLSIGAVDVPRGGDAPASEVEFQLRHSGARGAFLESEAHLEALPQELREQLDPVILLNGEGPAGTHGLEAIIALGTERLQREPDAVASRRQAIVGEDLATILYTSGTTGNPKGVRLRHANILHNLRVVPEVLDLRPGMRFLSFLPSWHTFERTIEYVILDAGMELHYTTKRHLKKDLGSVQPHFLVAVPRVWEMLHDAVDKKIQALKPPIGPLVRAALRASEKRAQGRRLLEGLILDADARQVRPNALQRIGLHLSGLLRAPAHALANATVYKGLKGALGGELQIAISGGGPLPPHVAEIFDRADLPILNGYGLTETAPVLSVNRPGRNLLGTIGLPLPETELRIVDAEGESLPQGQIGVIHARGPQVMEGYHDNPTATAAALDAEGWFNTGDKGRLAETGDLLITGRAKDTIVLRGGENIEPESLEATLCGSPLIADALVVGHGEKVLGALLVPDLVTLSAELGLAPPEDADAELRLRRAPKTYARMKAEVAARIGSHAGHRGHERIGPIGVLEDVFSIEEGTLTATLKKKRPIIEERFKAAIAALYSE